MSSVCWFKIPLFISYLPIEIYSKPKSFKPLSLYKG
jgi:hypothetical protein